MDNTIIQQGRFTSTGVNKTLQIRSDVDWMRVYNITIADADQTTAVGVEYYWQRGFAAGRGIEYKKSNAAAAANLTDYMASGGFTLVDSSLQTPNSPLLVTSIDTSAPPVVTANGSTGDLANGDVVRFINVASAQQLGGVDFTVGSVNADTSFTLAYMPAIAAGTTGSYRKIPFNPIYYPRRRTISAVTTGATTVVAMTVTHGYTVGQAVRFEVPSPAVQGMSLLNGLVGNVTAVNLSTNTITVDIDSSTFGSFIFGLSASVPYTPAQVVPVGEAANAAIADPNLLDDATVNQAYLGMVLGAGANGPAGQNNDVVYWVAGKSFSVDNQ